ncbi:hypothetical protein KF840_05750 [bacterium]|nr:hypothetical protein [bacterium]
MENQSALGAAVVIPTPARAAVSRNVFQRIYDRWRRAAHAVGVVQTRVIMMVLYLTVVVPTGVLMRLSRDPLHLRPPAGSNWLPSAQHERSVEAARRQF